MDPKIVSLESWTLIKISGPEKSDFLNGIITLELNNLDTGNPQLSLFLTPQAKIKSVFWVENNNDHYLLYCPPEYREALIEDLLKFKLSLNVKLEDVTEEIGYLYLERDQVQGVSDFSTSNTRFKFIITSEKVADIDASYKRFKHWLVVNDLIPPDIVNDLNPFEVGLNNSITLEKGCFLGQEPLSRIYYRGRLRSKLYHIVMSNSDLSLLSELSHKILSQVDDNENFHIIASVPVTKTQVISEIEQNENIRSVKLIGNYPNIDR